jgi:plasmid maintenance system antidote protein VapI
MNKVEKLLSEKYGKVRGSQTKLAKELKTGQSIVANWIAGSRDIGVDYIVKLSKIFGKSEEEIKNIFGVKDKIYQRAVGNKNIKGDVNKIVNISDREMQRKEFETINEKLKTQEAKIESLNLKLNLILERGETKKVKFGNG